MERITSFTGKYRWLSNFWPVTIRMYDMNFPSAEHAYQALKCKDSIEIQLFTQGTAAQAKKLGKTVDLRPDWKEVKLGAMEWVVGHKFSHPELAEKLLATENAILVEGNYWGDTYWGVCRGVGENNLGKILMQTRDELRALRS